MEVEVGFWQQKEFNVKKIREIWSRSCQRTLLLLCLLPYVGLIFQLILIVVFLLSILIMMGLIFCSTNYKKRHHVQRSGALEEVAGEFITK